jgi:molybdenum cofactor guanylyltransferase
VGGMSDIAGIVLAGGLSTRIGRDKGRLELGGQTLAARSVETMKQLFDEVIYVSNDAEDPSFEGIFWARDEVPHLGPLGGILAGLRAMEAERAFVSAYDMPFLVKELVELLAGYDLKADVVVPVIAGRFEPLHSVYSRRCLPVIAKRLGEGNKQIIGFYEHVKVATVAEEELRAVDPKLRSFFNVNTWRDFETAGEWIEAGG